MKEKIMDTNNLNKVILTDCDGVLLNWEYAFTVWMDQHFLFKEVVDPNSYDVGIRYGLTRDRKEELVRFFNESAAIGFLPPLRDAMYYVDLLHRKHGYTFHMITSLSKDESAQKLRIQNTQKLFGETAFTKFIFEDTGADKDDVLEPYRDSGLFWIEDKVENAQLGDRLGLESIVVEHAHNMNNGEFPTFASWKEIYEYITG
jgi:hypothetical protein